MYGLKFEACLHNLSLVLERCEERNLVLNWEKCHFMVKEDIVLGHKVSSKGIDVDKVKVDAIEELPTSASVKDAQCFLWYASIFRRIIKGFSKISSLFLIFL